MSNNLNTKKKGSKLSWLVGILVSVLAAGGGIVALLEYNDSVKKGDHANYQKEMSDWNNFSPESLSLGARTEIIVTSSPFDLEKGYMTNGVATKESDIIFRCKPKGMESLRVIKGVLWSDQGVMDFDKIKYRSIRDAKFSSPIDPKNGPNVLYIGHRSNAPRKGHVFFIKTIDGNIAKVQIVDYESVPDSRYCRKIKIKYEVFPIVKDPPKPKK